MTLLYRAWVLSLVPVAEAQIGSCPANFVSTRDLADDRAACTSACNSAGYCCTTNTGGCARATCSAGCLFAWHVDNETACVAECEAANQAGCTYTHAASKVELNNCFGQDTCGCPAEGDPNYQMSHPWGTSNDCSQSACAAGCRLAKDVTGSSFYGRELTASELEAINSAQDAQANALAGAMNSLSMHVSGQTVMTTAELTSASATIFTHRKLLKRRTSLINQALNLVDTFEASSHGPLFTSNGDFARSGSGDGRDLDRAMLAVQQAIIDDVYGWPGLIHECSVSLFEGRGWQTANYYPGAAAPPSDPSLVHTIVMNASHPKAWGRPVIFATDDIRKPTGLYLSPGQVATVSVPSAMVNAGYKVLVGAQTSDNSNKDMHKRMDRVTVTFEITRGITLVTNPLGGGLYILVPYLASLGRVEVSITGGVVEAPLFQRTSLRQMTNEEWRLRRTAPGPWADFETDKFMLNVPRSWIYNYDDPVSLLRDYDLAMDGTAEMFGHPPSVRTGGVHTLYLQPDLHIKAVAYGIGYPQVNNLFNARQTYDGNTNHWLIRNSTGWPVCYHELSHTQQRQDLTFQYRGETEAIVNYLWAYIRHVKFGDSFNAAFKGSMSHSNYEPDDAAVHWMITPNFREGKEMDNSNTEYDEFRYQHRGYAKYADIVRLFGWEAFTSYYHQENLDYMQGIRYQDSRYNFGLDSRQQAWPDIRTLRLSLKAGFDLTPLIHFWGIFPVNADALRSQMAVHNLTASNQVRCLLLRYRSLIPQDNAAFNIFFEKIHPGRPVVQTDDPRYGRGWYNVWRNAFDETHAQAAQAQVDLLLDTYFRADANSACDGVASGEGDVARPITYKWLRDFHGNANSATTTLLTTGTTTGTTTVTTSATATMKLALVGTTATTTTTTATATAASSTATVPMRTPAPTPNPFPAPTPANVDSSPSKAISLVLALAVILFQDSCARRQLRIT